MPTLFVFRGWRVVIFSNDHRPAHIHVLGAGQHARFELVCHAEALTLMDCLGFRLSELRAIQVFLTPHVGHLCEVWRQIHGKS